MPRHMHACLMVQVLGDGLGIKACGDVLSNRSRVSALFTPTASEFFLRVAMGLGPTRHTPPPSGDGLTRKGIRCVCNSMLLESHWFS